MDFTVLCCFKHMFGGVMVVSPRTYERAAHLEAELLRNLSVDIKDGEVVIKAKADGDLGLSKSEKTRLVASSGGFVALAGSDLAINVTITRPKS